MPREIDTVSALMECQARKTLPGHRRNTQLYVCVCVNSIREDERVHSLIFLVPPTLTNLQANETSSSSSFLLCHFPLVLEHALCQALCLMKTTQLAALGDSKGE